MNFSRGKTLTRYYIHNLNPIAFSVGNMHVPWYWLVYLVGFFGIYIFGFKLLNRGNQRISQSHWADYLSMAWVGLLIGSRLGYFSVYRPDILIDDPAELVRIWAGGMSFHGGILGGCLAIFMTAAYKKQSPWPIFDSITTLLPPFLGLGRVANFINGELAGRVTTVPWAMVFPSLYDDQPRHPSQLYEAFGEGLLLGIIMWRGHKDIGTPRKQTARFLIGYSMIRFGLEFFREPDRQLGFVWLGVTMGQVLSALFLLLGIYLARTNSVPSQSYHSP